MIDDRIMHDLQKHSRLKLGPEEEASLAGQLEDILHYFERLSAYDTSDIDPDIGTAVEPADLRRDERGESVGHETIESFAVDFEEGHFVVPRILGNATDA